MMDTNNNSTGSTGASHDQLLQFATSATLGDLNSGLSPFSLDSEDLFDIRNCPTPDVSKLNDDDLSNFIGNYDPFDDSNNDEIMSLLQSAKQTNSGEGDDPLAMLNDYEIAAAAANAFSDGSTPVSGLNEAAVLSPSSIFSALADGTATPNTIVNPLLHQNSSTTLLSSTASPFQIVANHNNINSFINHHSNSSFVPIKQEEDADIKTSELLLSHSEEAEMQLLNQAAGTSSSKSGKGGGRMKEKAMTRNAILARQNREKKKHEQESMVARLESLEEDNASLRKKVHEYKTGMENAQKRVRFLEAAIQNVPQIRNVIEHMTLIKNIPQPNPKGGGNSNSNNIT